MRCYWQIEAWVDGTRERHLVTASAAVRSMADGWRVRLLDEAEVVLGFVGRATCTAPWFIVSDVRFAGVVVARAAAALVFERLGWSVSETAAALGMAKSSVHELRESYRGHREVRRVLNLAEAFGNSGVRVLGGSV
jgi:hypothetical protein